MMVAYISLSKTRDKFVILRMDANPEPDYRITFTNAQCPILYTDTHRVEWLARMHFFEVQTRMIRIIPE